jgi:hypothetical protein
MVRRWQVLVYASTKDAAWPLNPRGRLLKSLKSLKSIRPVSEEGGAPAKKCKIKNQSKRQTIQLITHRHTRSFSRWALKGGGVVTLWAGGGRHAGVLEEQWLDPVATLPTVRLSAALTKPL